MKKRLISVFLLLALALSVAVPGKVYAAAKVKLNKAKATMEVDSKLVLKLGNVAAEDIKWSTSNKKVATVTAKGTITARAEGTANITATYSKKKYTCKVTVVDSNKEEVKDTTSNSESKNKDIEVLAEYTLPDGIGWYTRHFMIIKNNSNKTLDISTSSLAYTKGGTMVGAASSDLYALGAGCTSVLYEAFETSDKIDRYKTEINSSSSKHYKSVIQDLSYVQNDIENGAVFQVTNNGKDAAEFVEGYALFFLGGKLVEYESAYFADDDYEIKPGKTISKQLTSYGKFDKIEFYLTGRK